jgi:hypothetical protein
MLIAAMMKRNVPETLVPIRPVYWCRLELSSWTGPTSAFTPRDNKTPGRTRCWSGSVEVPSPGTVAMRKISMDPQAAGITVTNLAVPSARELKARNARECPLGVHPSRGRSRLHARKWVLRGFNVATVEVGRSRPAHSLVSGGRLFLSAVVKLREHDDAHDDYHDEQDAAGRTPAHRSTLRPSLAQPPAVSFLDFRRGAAKASGRNAWPRTVHT